MEGAHYKLSRFMNIKDFNHLFKFPAPLHKPKETEILQSIKENEKATNKKFDDFMVYTNCQLRWLEHA